MASAVWGWSSEAESGGAGDEPELVQGVGGCDPDRGGGHSGVGAATSVLPASLSAGRRTKIHLVSSSEQSQGSALRSSLQS